MVENFAGIVGTLGVIPNTAINKQTKVLTHLLSLVADGNSSSFHDSPTQSGHPRRQRSQVQDNWF